MGWGAIVLCLWNGMAVWQHNDKAPLLQEGTIMILPQMFKSDIKPQQTTSEKMVLYIIQTDPKNNFEKNYILSYSHIWHKKNNETTHKDHNISDMIKSQFI